MQKELISAYIKATNSHNFDNLISLLSNKPMYLFSDKTCNTIEEIRIYFEHAWDTIKEEVYSANNIVCIIDNDCIQGFVYDYHYEGYFQGKFVSGGGKATNIFEQIDGEWKLILEHLN